MDGSLLGIVIDKDERPGSVPWLFRPPVIGQEVEARNRATGLKEKLRSLRRTQGGAAHHGLFGKPVSAGSKDQAGEIAWVRVASRDEEAASGSAELPSLAASAHHPGDLMFVKSEAKSLSATPAFRASVEEGETEPDRESLDKDSPIPATRLFRIKEVTQVSWVTVRPKESEIEAPCQESINARLKAEIQEGQRYRAHGERQTSSSSNKGGRGQLSDKTVRKSATGTRKHLPDPRTIAPNLYMEHHRKDIKRTRSELEFLSNTIGQTMRPSSALTRLRPSTACGSRDRAARTRDRLSPKKVTDLGRPRTAPCARIKNTSGRLQSDELRRDSTAAVRMEAGSSAPDLQHAWTTLAPMTASRLREGAT